MSFVGFSLGGLYGRYCIGLMKEEDFFGKYQARPLVFMSVVSPHLGARPALCITAMEGETIIGKLGTFFRRFPRSSFYFSLFLNSFLAFIFGQTGKEILLKDDICLCDSISRPDSTFLTALEEFKHHFLLSNAVEELQVPYYSSSISTDFQSEHRSNKSQEISLKTDNEMVGKLIKEKMKPTFSNKQDLADKPEKARTASIDRNSYSKSYIEMQEIEEGKEPDNIPPPALWDAKLDIICQISKNLNEKIKWQRAHFRFDSVFAHVMAIQHPQTVKFISDALVSAILAAEI